MPMRITGLGSGMDIDTIVSDLMKAQRAPIDKLYQKKQLMEWKREDYRTLNTKIYQFRNKLFDFTLQGTFQAKKATVTSGDSVTAVSAKGSFTGSLEINVTQKATAATAVTGSIGTGIDANKTIKDLMDTGKLAAATPDSGTTYSFTINGKSISFDSATTTLNQLITRINNETNTNVYFDSASGRLAFSADETGLIDTNNDKTVDGDTIVFGSESFLVDTFMVGTATHTAAQQAKATVTSTINGLTTVENIVSNSNTITAKDVTLSIQKTGISTVSTSVDEDAIVEKIKAFIKDYNDVLSSIQEKTNEKKKRGYDPLTAEQKKAFKEEGEDIDEWQKFARAGLLRNDNILSSLATSMRMAVASEVDTGSSTYRSLASIGIETTPYVKGSKENGNLVLGDEAKLREAIRTDLDSVIAIFNHGTGADKQDGIAVRMYRDMKTAIDNLTQKAGNPNSTDDDESLSLLGNELKLLNRKLEEREVYLKKLEDKYYKQFAAMERAMSQMAAQQSQLFGAFGGGQ
ncbi:flagellar filament capping protein FliD [Paenibacillus thermoaerophilus]|uniref:Flagellar hook-associated protein 2 n=1 Tax=Paenibacillus thermoaerophilus TaxID=1215385 RepID=A0ABW2V7A9_9BACL|nr:flagellar filament capping protein FliD [Paenibacillus thermoaerophilus]TMV09217.1 hypothetical protein FE781_14885 [Paenibacillus thermoaerophilus]